jgi:hypothetical protein
VEAICNEPVTPTFALYTEVLPDILQFEQYVSTTFTDPAEGGPGGTNGIFGEEFSSVYRNYYESNTGGFKGLTVTTALFSQVNMELPPSQDRKHSCTLDKFAKRAVSMLPPPPTNMSTIASEQWWATHRDLFTKFFELYGTAVIVSGQIGGMIELCSTYTNRSIPEATLMEDAQNDFTRLTGTGGNIGKHDPQLHTPETPTCIGGDPTKCTHDSIENGSWGESTAPPLSRLLRYKVVPLSEFFDGSDMFGPDLSNVKQSIEQGLTAYVNERKQRVTWSWDVKGIGGNCSKVATEGQLQESPGTSQVVAGCNNGCTITLTCKRTTDGSLTAIHHGCGEDAYHGKPVTAGCSVVVANGQVDKNAGQCCIA